MITNRPISPLLTKIYAVASSAAVVISSTLLLSFFAANVFAHGEDRPGPHGGKIRMPGGFHTEVLAVTPTLLRVYLLDIKFSDPTVTDSSVSISVNEGPAVSCQPYSDYFSCEVTASTPLNGAGKLSVTATRLKHSGAPAIYPLPLQ